MKRVAKVIGILLIGLIILAAVLVRFASPWIIRKAIAFVEPRAGVSIEVDKISGSIFSPVELTGLSVNTTNQQIHMSAERVVVHYRLSELMLGRVHLSELVVDSPDLDLNLVGPPRESNVSSRAVRISQLVLSDGVMHLVTGTNDGDARSFDARDVSFTVNDLQLGGPESDFLVDIAMATGRLIDPDVALADLAGEVRMVDDTISFRLPSVDLREASASVTGWLHGSGTARRMNVDVAFDNLTPVDVPFEVVALEQIAYRAGGTLRLVENGMGIREVLADSVHVTVDTDSTDLTVRGTVTLGPSQTWLLTDARIAAINVSTTVANAFLDSSLVSGVVVGTVLASGRQDSLLVDADAAYVDARDRARSVLVAKGIVDLSDPKTPTFTSVLIDDLRVDLRTAHRISDRIPPVGQLGAIGTLSGSLTSPTFRGVVQHRDAPWPVSSVTGEVRGLEYANLQLDSIQPDLIEALLDSVNIPGTLIGRVEMRRRADSTVLDSEVQTAAGVISLHAEGPVRRSFASLDGTFSFSSVNLAAVQDRLPVTTLVGSGEGSLVFTDNALQRWGLDVQLASSIVSDVPLDSMSVQARGDSTGIMIDNLRLDGNTFRGTAEGVLSVTDTPSGRVVFDLTSDSLAEVTSLASRWLPPALEGLSGSGTAAGTISGTLREYDLNTSLNLPTLSLGSAAATNARVALSWQAGPGSVDVRAQAGSMVIGSMSFSDVDAVSRGPTDSLSVFAQANQLDNGAWSLVGSLLARDTSRSIRLDSALVPLGGRGWRLVRPSTITLSDSGFGVTSLVLREVNSAAQVEMSGNLSTRASGRFSGTITELELQDVMQLLGRDSSLFAGELNGSFEVVGSAQAPRAVVDVVVRNGVARQLRVKEARSQISYDDGHLIGRTDVVGDSAPIAVTDFDLPIAWRLAPFSWEKRPGPLQASLQMDEAPLSTVSPFFPTWQDPRGRLRVTANLSGSWDDPKLTGRLNVEEGQFVVTDVGVPMHDLEAQIAIDGDTVRIERLEIQSGDGASRATGYVDISDLTNPAFAVRASATRFPAIDLRDYMTMIVTGEVVLTGSFAEPRLTGSGTAERGSVSFADVLEKQIVDLDDPLFAPFVDTVLLRQEGLSSAAVSQLIRRLRIDSLRVALGNDFWMRSGEGDVQLAGNLMIGKIQDTYNLNGTLNAERGTYRLQLAKGVTREFTVTRGTVQYFGTSDLDADLDIDARHTVRTFGDATVNIFAHLGGTLYRPTVTLSSDIRPSVSDGELISYLLFGAPTVQAVAGQGGMQSRLLVEAVDQFALALSGQAQSFVRGLGVPLDYLQIRPGDVNQGLSGTEIAIGKQFSFLGKPAFLTASPRLCPRQSFFSTSNIGASLESRLAGRFSLSASVDPVRVCETATASISTRYQLGVDLLWEKRQD